MRSVTICTVNFGLRVNRDPVTKRQVPDPHPHFIIFALNPSPVREALVRSVRTAMMARADEINERIKADPRTYAAYYRAAV